MNDDYAKILVKLTEEYAKVEKHKHHIEGKTATTIVNVKFIENLRHSYSHLITGIKFQFKNEPPEKTLEQYKTALTHLKNLDVNGYEYLAGVLLKRLKQKIESSGYFVDVGKANNYFDEAVSKFGAGRSARSEDKEAAMTCFESCIDLCQDGLREVIPSTRAEKTRLSLATVSLIVAIIALLVVLLN